MTAEEKAFKDALSGDGESVRNFLAELTLFELHELQSAIQYIDDVVGDLIVESR